MDCITVNSGVTTLVKSLSGLSDNIITMDSTVTYDVQYCGEFALYYINQYGGWDSFLIEGKVRRYDDLTRHNYFRSYDNTTAEFSEKNYVNEVKPRWELHTSWLSDSQAEILAKNLIPSTCVYGHLLAEDKIFPVLITDTNVEYKRYKNDRKLVSYTIQIKESQEKIRR